MWNLESFQKQRPTIDRSNKIEANRTERKTYFVPIRTYKQNEQTGSSPTIGLLTIISQYNIYQK